MFLGICIVQSVTRWIGRVSQLCSFGACELFDISDNAQYLYNFLIDINFSGHVLLNVKM